jgi:hypothetical protein
LLAGTITAFLIHLTAMHTPLGQWLLQSEPVALRTWGVLFLLALTIFPVMELHKWIWKLRYPGDRILETDAELRRANAVSAWSNPNLKRKF